MTTHPSPWLAARNLLAVRLDNAGDVVMLGPALQAVKTASPQAKITLLASPAGTQAAALLPWLADVITWRAIWQDLGHLPWDPHREHDLVSLLRDRAFDGALIFTSFSQSPLPPAYACLFAGIPLRAGESLEFGGKVLSHEVKETAAAAHQVERNLRLVEALGFAAADRALAVAIPDPARQAAIAQLRAAGIELNRPYALIHPGASAVARRYPPAAWGAVARLLEKRGLRTLLTGVEKERPLLAEAAAGSPNSAVLVGETSLVEYAALVERAAVVLCGNTLPLHLADAVSTPVVAAYSGTDLESQWRPRSVPHVLLRRPTPCHPCYRFDCPVGLACLAIPPEELADAAIGLSAHGSNTVPVGRSATPVGAETVEPPLVPELAPASPTVGEGPAPSLVVGDGSVPADDSVKSTREPAAAAPAITVAHPTRHSALGTRHFRRTRRPAPSTPARIAVFQALALGDLLCATPALDAIRSAFPKAEITAITLPWAEEVLLRAGLVDRVVPFPGWPGIAEAPYEPARLAAILSRIAADPFDLAFQMHGSGSVSNGFVATLAPRRSIGYAFGSDSRLTDALPWAADESEVGRWLRLVEHAGISVPDHPRPVFPTSADDRARARLMLRSFPAGEGPLVGLHAGASVPARRWPPARFAEVAARLHRDHDARLVLTGSDSERGIAAEVSSRAGVPVLDLAGETDLFTVAALVEGLDLLITNDTGVSHLAAAAGAPSVVLFGPSDPLRWAPPDRNRHFVVDAVPPGADRAAVGTASLANLDVAPVLAAAERQLAAFPSGGFVSTREEAACAP